MNDRATAMWLGWVVAGICLLVSPARGSAQETDAERAQQHADEGAKLYAKGEYADALVRFRKAYQLSREPVLLFNVAISYSKIGRCERALEKGDELRSKFEISEKLASTNSGMMAACRQVLSAREVAGRAAAAKERAARRSSESSSSDATTDDMTEPTEPADPPRSDPSGQTRSGMGALGWTGIAALGLGSAGLVGSAVVEQQVESDFREFESAGNAGDSERYNELKSSISRKQTTGRVLLFSGAGLTVAGGALLLAEMVGGGADRRSSIRFSGGAAAGRAFLRMEMSFR